MLKIMISAHRHASMSRPQFFSHLRDKHAPLVLGNRAYMQYLRRYIQNHTELPSPGVRVALPCRHAVDRDSVIELWYDNVESLQRANSDPLYLQHIRPDELRFNDTSDLVVLFTEEIPIMGATRAPGSWKAFDFVRKHDSADPRDFQQALRLYGETVAADPTCRKRLRRRVHNLVMTGDATAFAPPANYDAVFETWVDGLEDLAILMQSSPFNVWPASIDRARSFSVLAREVPIFDPPEYHRRVE